MNQLRLWYRPLTGTSTERHREGGPALPTAKCSKLRLAASSHQCTYSKERMGRIHTLPSSRAATETSMARRFSAASIMLESFSRSVHLEHSLFYTNLTAGTEQSRTQVCCRRLTETFM